MSDDDLEFVNDDDFNDIITGDIHKRNWRLVGSTSPIDVESRGAKHFTMSYIGREPEVEPEVEVDASIFTNPMISNGIESIEIMPVAESLLEQYYTYFSEHVALDKKDQLINICRQSIKSPCFDIRNCYIVEPKEHVSLDNYAKIVLDKKTYVLLIPSSIICNMKKSLDYLEINIEPDSSDDLAYSGSRLQISGICTFPNIKSLSWKDARHLNDFNKILNCKAVATATFTVSMILRQFQGYVRTKTLVVVVHAIKK